MIFFLLLAFLPATLARIYERCELARELKFVHGAPGHQLATWVCIAEHESRYNTSIVGHLNGDGSGDHGIFQISDKFWCSPPGKGYACGVTCAELEDDDISDDFLCAQRIYKEHKTLSGDGFNAWAVYTPHCKGPKADAYVKGCFNDSEEPKQAVPEREPVFAHGFFGRARGFSTSTETPTFDAFFTPSTTSAYAPTTFFTTRRTNFFRPIPTRTTVFSRPTIHTPTAVSSFAPQPGRSTIFGSSRSFFAPTTSAVLRSTTTTTTAAPRTQTTELKPIFIINGVKWY